ncbi:Uncharacterised protein [Mycobacterium tuberculosis]|nr:Uncharacterised protein [Mycobacterium tuberculosis]
MPTPVPALSSRSLASGVRAAHPGSGMPTYPCSADAAARAASVVTYTPDARPC